MFVHWLGIGGIDISLNTEDLQWKRLKDYMKQYPNSKATVFNRNSGNLFERIVRLECSQRYRDLDLECNSGYDDSLRILDRKPYNIELCGVQTGYFFDRLERKDKLS